MNDPKDCSKLCSRSTFSFSFYWIKGCLNNYKNKSNNFVNLVNLQELTFAKKKIILKNMLARKVLEQI